MLGCLLPNSPSAVFRLSIAGGNGVTTFGASLEPLTTIQNLSPPTHQDRVGVANKIAMDLYHFMSSFVPPGNAGNTHMTVPTGVFERWIKRFKEKSSRDPDFFLKVQD
mmetsp:Transcript_11584/g.23079  ORF Transcript_11584/g.23079 Transcript_11584/m.23079 type:complete len:108 (+) Transcript_11584:62-385(+)